MQFFAWILLLTLLPCGLHCRRFSEISDFSNASQIVFDDYGGSGGPEKDEWLVLLDVDSERVITGTHFLDLQHLFVLCSRQLGNATADDPLSSSSYSSFDEPNYLREIFHNPPFISGYCGVFHQVILEYLRTCDEVVSVERNALVSVPMESFSTQDSSILKAHSHPDRDSSEAEIADVMAKISRQTRPPWGLDRISTEFPMNPLPEDEAPWGEVYLYPRDAGRGVTVYVVDTGIQVDHPDFGGRARWGVTIPDNSSNVDEQGHGTHVAGTIGSLTYGVAKSVSMVAIKVFQGRGGPVSNVVKGIAWAIKDYQERLRRQRSDTLLAVINLSITIPKSSSILAMARAAARNNLLIVAAAGNTAVDICARSPLHNEASVLSVGAYCPDFSLVKLSPLLVLPSHCMLFVGAFFKHWILH